MSDALPPRALRLIAWLFAHPSLHSVVVTKRHDTLHPLPTDRVQFTAYSGPNLVTFSVSFDLYARLVELDVLPNFFEPLLPNASLYVSSPPSPAAVTPYAPQRYRSRAPGRRKQPPAPYRGRDL